MDNQQGNQGDAQKQAAQPTQQPAQQQQPLQHQTAQNNAQQQANPQNRQPQKPTWKSKLKEFSKECWRVLRVTKKPDKTEFQTFVKVSGIGILLIGFIGFLIHLVKELFL